MRRAPTGGLRLPGLLRHAGASPRLVRKFSFKEPENQRSAARDSGQGQIVAQLRFAIGSGEGMSNELSNDRQRQRHTSIHGRKRTMSRSLWLGCESMDGR